MCEKKKTPHEVGLGGADNGTRTRGLNLGKVALYQLSYVRCAYHPWDNSTGFPASLPASRGRYKIRTCDPFRVKEVR